MFLIDIDDEKSEGNDKVENDENENEKLTDSDERVSNDVIFPRGFPSELQSVEMPDEWKPQNWTILLWFGAPCELLFDRTISVIRTISLCHVIIK